MKKTTIRTLEKQRQTRWLITGVTTMILTVTAMANQTAYADNLPTASVADPSATTQTTATNSLRQTTVSLKSKPAATATSQAASHDQQAATSATENSAGPSASSATEPQSSAATSEANAAQPVSESNQTSATSSTSSRAATSQASAKSPAVTSEATQGTSQDQKVTTDPQLTPKPTARPALRSRARLVKADESIDDWMPNKLLQQEVLRQLRAQNPGRTWNSAADITKDDMLLLKTYHGTNTYIDGKTEYSLAGLQYATNLTSITLNNALDLRPISYYYGDVTDLSPLSGLTKLTSLDARNNRITDVSTLKNLVNLQSLWVDFNHIADFSSLKNLPKLTDLEYGNQALVNLNPIMIDKNNPNYHLASPARLLDGSVAPLAPANGIAENVILNWNNYQYSYKFYFLGADNATSDGNGGLEFTNLKPQPTSWWSGDANGQYQGINVVPVKDFYYMVGAYRVGTVYFAVVQAYELTDAAQPVTVKYQDSQGNSLAKDTVLNGMVGETYTASAPSFENFQLTSTTGNATGTFSDTAQTVIFTYTRMDAGDVTFKFQDKNGKTIAADATIPGKEHLGMTLNVTVPEIENYLKPANVTITFTTENQTYTLIYTQKDAGDVTVKYQDADGNQLAADKILSGQEQLGNAIPDQTLNIPNYTFVKVLGASEFAENAQVVTYVYTRSDAGDVTIKYQDEHGNKLADDVLLSGQGKLGLAIPDQQLTIPGYTYKALQSRAIGIFGDQPQTLIYVYTRNVGKTVTVKYQDENGQTLHEDVLLNGYEGAPYTSEQLAIKNYTFKTVQGNVSGLFTDQPQTITYTYTRNAGKTVTVKYQDENGKALHPDVLLNGYEGDAYASEQLAIKGYSFKAVQGNISGLFADQPQTVTYIYTRNAGKTVTVKYQDENGKALHADVLLNGYEGDAYTSEQLTIKGYTFKTIQGNATGTFTDQSQTVTYVYTRNAGQAVTVKYQDENGQPLHPDMVLNGDEGDAYTSQPLAITGYTFKAVQGNANGTFTATPQTVTYVYTKNAPVDPITTGTVTVHYVTNDNQTLKTVTLTGNVGTNYQTSALNFKGYQLVQTPANAAGQYTTDHQEVTFVYKAVPVTDGGTGDHVIDPDKPTKPEKPTKPVTPTNPEAPATEQPGQVTTVDRDHVTPTKPGQPTTVPDQTTTVQAKRATKAVRPAKAQIIAKRATGDLPQTNEQASPLSLIWIGVMSLLAALGLAKKHQD